MRCPKCGHENAKGVELCQGCGKVKFISKKKAAGMGGLMKSPIPAAKPSSKASTVRVPRPSRPIPPTDDGEALAPAPPPKKSTKRVVPPTIEVPPPAAASRPTGRKARPAPTRHWLAPVGSPPIELPAGKPFTLGRDESCTLPIPSGRVSRLHAEIQWDGDRPVLVDKGSANGTYVGGAPIGERHLEPGDEIEIGPFLCVYKTGDLEGAAPKGREPLKTLIDQGELLGGSIKEGGLAEVFQGIDFNKKTGTLIVFSSDGQGWVTFENGAPRAAQSALQTDEEAVFALLALNEGRFSFTTELRTTERRMKTTVTALLLEWGRRADEAGR